jgi:Fcf2 pre-rRNA processing
LFSLSKQKANKWKRPAYFGVGTVQDDPKDFYSSRVPRKMRKQTLADELLGVFCFVCVFVSPNLNF